VDSIPGPNQLTPTADSLGGVRNLLAAMIAFVYSPNITTLGKVVNGILLIFYQSDKNV
jgi:hypothetical protein